MFVELKTVYNEMEAQVLVTHLNEENIKSIIDKDDAGGMHPQLQSARGVKVLVHEDDIEIAKKLINTENKDMPTWTCPSCNEIHEGQFSICWNCGEKREN